jgi:cell division protein FtsB
MEKIKAFFKNLKSRNRQLLIIVIIIILVLLMMDFNNRMVVLLRLNQQRDQLNTQVIQVEQTKQILEERIQYASSDKALEEWAREQARMIEEGDIPIIILSPADQKFSPTPVPETTIKAVSRWEVWRELFFGD